MPESFGGSGVFFTFNPRAHAGRDLVKPHLHTMIRVSIHAPTRGATPRRRSRARTPRFNPRAHTGRDLLSFDKVHYVKFQSTRPRGARLHALFAPFHKLVVSIHSPTRGATTSFRAIARHRRFNPRAHAGRDIIGC